YVRSIPNWPRYSIQGDARLGNHDLLIRNVTKSDAGSFECQVSPADGHPPLRRQTTLSILIKPSQPVVIAPSGEPQPLPNGQLIVPRHAINSSTSSEMQNYLRLICESHGGVPPPTFEWFHNGISVKPERADDPEEQDGMPVGGQSRTGSKEIHSVSVILLRDKLQTGDRIVCLVSNKATLRSKLLSHQKMRSELIVVIHSPPGDPEIIDWSRSSDQSNIFVEGAQFEATCRADPAGNPPGELFWRWERPRQPLETSVDSRLPKVTLDIVAQIVSAVPPEHVVHQYSEGKLLSKVRIPLLKSEYHGLDLVCAVKHQVGPEKSARIPILVRYGPESVYIHGPEETTDILKQTPKFGTNMTSFEVKTLDLHNRLTYVYLDRPQYLLCMTGTYYDQAVIQWFGLSNRSGEWREIQPLETFSRKTANASNRFIMFSIVKLVSTNVERPAFEWVGIKCKAGQTPGQFTVENQTVLRIYEPPGKPTITGYEPGNLFQEETNLTLDCEATPGSPPGYLLWMTSFDRKTDDELQLINSTSRMNAQSKLTSSFEITLNRANNGLSIWCVSVNDGYNVSERQTSLPVRLEVAYAATTINLTVSDGFGRLIVPRDGIHRIPKTIPDNPFAFINSSVATAESDTIISITCHVERSNPRPLIQWRRYDCPVTTNVSGNYSLEESAMRKHCAVTPLKGEDDNAQSTNVVRSRISISLNWSHHGDFIECFTQPPATYHSGQDVSSAESNSRFLSTGSSSGLREYVVLNIRFKPVFIRPSDHRQQRAQQIAMDDENYPTPQYIAIEGGTVDLDLTPLANPPVHKLVWYKENQQLISSPAHTNRDGGQMRIFIENSRLHISPVEVSDMSYYTLIASNTMGSTRFKFFLNVTFGPQLIGKPIINITATGKKAQLECEARANPTPTENAVRWRRISHSFTGMDYATQLPRPNTVSEIPKKTEEESLADSVTGIRCNKGKWHNGFKYFAKCWSKSPGTLTSLLTIYDLGPSDVGRYQCHMDNAIGSPAVRIVDLIYPFAPRIIHIQRWSKAAPGPVTGSLDSENTETNQSPQTNGIRRQARLTCVIAAEPQPEVTWSREPANLTLVEGGQFRSQMKLIHPGLYHAILYLSQPRDEDNGLYFCKASNLVGEDSGRVELMKASKPDVPQVPRLVNATSTTLAVTWTQGFNGGPKQIFQLRWASNENPESYTQTEVEEVLESETVTHVISGLQKATTYRVAVSSRNEVFGSTRFTQYLLASTRAYDPIPDKEAMHDEARAKSRIGVGGGHWDIQHQNENRNGFVGERGGSEPGAIQRGLVGQTSGDKATLTIVMASSFGAIVLIANLLIILLLAHRKRKKSGLQQKSSITVFPGNELMQLCPSGLSFNDINGEQRHMYAAYGEGASLSEDVLVQNRSTDQFSQFHTGFSPSAVNGRTIDNFHLATGHLSFTGSPHPSLQAINPLNVHTPTHLEFGGQLSSNFTDPELNALSYLNTDMSPTITDRQGNPLFSINPSISESARNTQVMPVSERRTPISIRVNAGLGAYPNIGAQRIESPNSGAASSISAARSVVYPNTNSLERNAYFCNPHAKLSHHQNNSLLVRQASFGQYTPNGTFTRNHSPYGTHQTALRQNVSSFTPTHTLLNSRTRTNLGMAASLYADRGMSPSHNSHIESPGQNDLMPTMGTCQLVRRGSYNSEKSRNISPRMNTSEMLDAYLQRYNEQLEAVRAMVRTRSPSKHGSELDGNFQETRNYHDGLEGNLPLDHPPPTDNLIIPPPNAFGSANHHYSPSVSRPRVDLSVRPIYRGSDEDGESQTTLLSPNYHRPPENETQHNAPVKHPTPDQALIYTMENQSNYPRFTSLL
ncbi:hypothetical protein T265_14339, partial [Opisthorchis viverrini]